MESLSQWELFSSTGKGGADSQRKWQRKDVGHTHHSRQGSTGSGIRAELEKIVEPLFHPSSFGYRPGKSAHDAVEQCAKNCWERWYVVDLDIKGFFDNIDHEQMMDILQKAHKSEAYFTLLRAMVESTSTEAKWRIANKKQRTPQGGVISPLLANLYLHEAFDQWLANTQPRIVFERYADDIVIHTRSLEQSNFILDKLKGKIETVFIGSTSGENKDCILLSNREIFTRRVRRYRCLLIFWDLRLNPDFVKNRMVRSFGVSTSH